MTETERIFVFTTLAILIGDRRMFPPLSMVDHHPDPRRLGHQRPVHSEWALTRGKSLTLLEIGRSWSRRSNRLSVRCQSSPSTQFRAREQVILCSETEFVPKADEVIPKAEELLLSETRRRAR
jgi:hypothetical protein